MESGHSPGTTLIGCAEIAERAGAGRIRMSDRAEQAPSLVRVARPRLVQPDKEVSVWGLKQYGGDLVRVTMNVYELVLLGLLSEATGDLFRVSYAWHFSYRLWRIPQAHCKHRD